MNKLSIFWKQSSSGKKASYICMGIGWFCAIMALVVGFELVPQPWDFVDNMFPGVFYTSDDLLTVFFWTGLGGLFILSGIFFRIRAVKQQQEAQRNNLKA